MFEFTEESHALDLQRDGVITQLVAEAGKKVIWQNGLSGLPRFYFIFMTSKACLLGFGGKRFVYCLLGRCLFNAAPSASVPPFGEALLFSVLLFLLTVLLSHLAGLKPHTN